jgi:hypothetical protein
MEESGCCSGCPVVNPDTFLVPAAWHPDKVARMCGLCFTRRYPHEAILIFDLTVLSKWREEGFAPAHVMRIPGQKKLRVLQSQLDDHHVTMFRSWAHDGAEDELLRQVARDYRETKDALVKMSTRAWWDQMAFWREVSFYPIRKQ